MTQNEFSYKKVLQNVVLVEKPMKNPIQPGWFEVSYSGRNVVYRYGDPTPNMIKREQQEELNNNLHYNAVKVFDKMVASWEAYEQLYDELNGENAYADKYRLPPVYNFDDDDDDDQLASDSDEELEELLEAIDS